MICALVCLCQHSCVAVCCMFVGIDSHRLKQSYDWCSEYRQAEGSVVSAVALRLLTTDAPPDTTQDLKASAQLVSSTGIATFQLLVLPCCCCCHLLKLLLLAAANDMMVIKTASAAVAVAYVGTCTYSQTMLAAVCQPVALLKLTLTASQHTSACCTADLLILLSKCLFLNAFHCNKMCCA